MTSTDDVPAGRAAWFAVAVMVVVTLFAFVDRQVISLVAAPMATDLALTDSQLGVVQGLVFAVFGVVATYPLGWLADRIDRRVVLCGCVIVWAAGTAACGLVHSYTALLGATLAIAAGEAGLVPVIYAAIPDLFRGRQRIAANQIFYIASDLGSSAGLFIGGAAVAALESAREQLPEMLSALPGWRIVFLFVAAPAPLIVLLICLTKLGRAKAGNGVVKAQPTTPNVLRPYLKEHGRAVALVFAGICAFGLPFDGLFAFTPVALARMFGTSPAYTGTRLGIGLAIASVIGVSIGAWLLRRFLPRLGTGAALRISVYALVAMLPIVLLFPFITAPWQALWIISALMGAGTLIGSLLPTIIQGVAPPALRGRVTAVYTILGAALNGLGTYAVGPLSDALSSQRGLLVAMTTVSVLAWAIAALLLRLVERPYMKTIVVLSAAETSSP